MNTTPNSMLRQPLEKRAEAAFKIAVAKAIDEHARLGFPIYVWRKAKVVRLSPAQVRRVSRSKRQR